MAKARWPPSLGAMVLAGAIAATVACTGGDPRSPAPTTATTTTTTFPDVSRSSGLAATIRQFREDEALGQLQVQIVRAPSGAATPSDPVDVTAVRLAWPGFADAAPTPHVVAVAPGQRVDVPVPLGEPRCDTPAMPAVTLGHVEIAVLDDLGRTAALDAPLLDDAADVLGRIWESACRRHELLERVSLTFDPGWTRSDPDGTPTASGTLVLRRRDRGGAEPVAVTSVDGSVLVSLRRPDGDAAVLVAGADELRLPVLATASGRCDGHALGDSKKTYDFEVVVAVGAADPIGFEISVPSEDRPVLAAVVADTCARAATR